MDTAQLHFAATELSVLFTALQGEGFEILGPTVRNQTIVYETLRSVADLPQGWTDEQEKGFYRLRRRNDNAYFAFNVGPQSWKQFLFSAREKLFSARKLDKKIEITPEEIETKKRVFLGVRACEIAAIGIQDQVFLKGAIKDQPYARRRDGVMIIAVNCTKSSNTCFCVSMQTGPRVEHGYDVALTEVLTEDDHHFIARAGTALGQEFLDKLNTRLASEREIAEEQKVVEQAARQQGRTLETQGIKELLYNNLEHARWDEVANRCLSCANCTLVCPTCFCSTAEDVTDLTGDHTERWRRWDSCFTLDHSYIHGGSVHGSVKSRYRQWMTHKLASWIDQFGTSGCVGCGRCIAWCPVGIDLTEEARAIREGEKNASKNNP